MTAPPTKPAGVRGIARRLRRGRVLRQPLRYPKDRLQRIFVPGIRFDSAAESSTLLIAFGGLRGRLDLPAFEFLGVTGEFPVKRLYVRDLHQAWYHRGLPRQGSRSLIETAERLKELIEPHGVERVVTIGNSSGGYAALAFGALLGADVALAFSPQTTIDRADMAAMNDHRWDEQLQKLWERGRLDQRWTDLRRALPSALAPGTSLRVYYNERLPVDRLHAEHLDGLQGVTLFPFGFGSGHYLVNTLRKRGLLEQILLDAVNGRTVS